MQARGYKSAWPISGRTHDKLCGLILSILPILSSPAPSHPSLINRSEPCSATPAAEAFLRSSSPESRLSDLFEQRYLYLVVLVRLLLRESKSPELCPRQLSRPRQLPRHLAPPGGAIIMSSLFPFNSATSRPLSTTAATTDRCECGSIPLSPFPFSVRGRPDRGCPCTG